MTQRGQIANSLVQNRILIVAIIAAGINYVEDVMKKILIQCLAWFVAGWFAPGVLAQTSSSDDHTYMSNFSTIMKLGRDVYGALKPQYREQISPQPISIDTAMIPFVKVLYYPEEPKPMRGVWISAGFIDLVNRLAHAKAIDQKEKGYFQKYIQILAEETGEKELKPLPNDSNPAFWTDEMLNEQLSNFNSIVGMVVGIKLAHHYLGQYDKYKDKLTDAQGNSLAINNLLTPKEWDEALAKGRNALDAGCTIEGVLPFYEAFEKMLKRPAWTAFFMPDSAKFKKTKKDLEKIQENFFKGGD